MRGRRTLEEAASMIELRRSGGLTIQAFCEAENPLCGFVIRTTQMMDLQSILRWVPYWARITNPRQRCSVSIRRNTY